MVEKPVPAEVPLVEEEQEPEVTMDAPVVTVTLPSDPFNEPEVSGVVASGPGVRGGGSVDEPAPESVNIAGSED